MYKKQSETPLFSRLVEHASNNPTPFHIPGHKQGKGVDPEFQNYIGQNAFQLDLINIAPLDDLHHPRAAIKKAQELAADVFHADHSFFSVQGTSGSVLTMILSVCQPGDKILVPRNIHKSVLSAMILADATPIFIHPELDQKLLISHGITKEQVKATIQAHPDAKALFLINPSYYGVAGEIEEIVAIAHRHQLVVLVDEAHGVLHTFHEELPISAMDAGADMAATSVHKLGGSLTQSSILNIKKARIDPQHVQLIANMLTTTSTSYLLLTSLDTQRRYLALHGHQAIDRTLRLAEYARTCINQIPGLFCPENEFFAYASVYDLDRTKLTIHLEQLNISGHDAENWLRKVHHIEVELSDLYNILCLITIGDDEESIEKLVAALQALSEEFYQAKIPPRHLIHIPELPELVMTPREAFYHKNFIMIPLEQSVNYISAESISIYPPGIPVLLPGERITREHIAYIQSNLAAELPIQGAIDPTIQMVRVIR